MQNVDQLEAVYEKSYETIMGNCDTHLFLGSNSYKTLEYFSKQLGEKTIGRDSISVNKDKQNHKTGKSVSDQVMARALMTPDELRRLDNDLCIIFEKGIRPIKARKFYYFEHPMAKEMKRYAISHNDIGEIERGEWRKYNPYNPYVPEQEEEKVNDLKVESLDDLFEDEDLNTGNSNNNIGINKSANNNANMIDNDINSISLEQNQENSRNDSTSIGMENQKLNLEQEFEAPILPQTNIEENEEDEYDLQKELEAKFDELFGQADD